MRDRADRRLATVLFVDIVNSSLIATEAGDRRWRELLKSYRRAVRRRIKRHGGHEEDTAGDGFFATFERPASAVRAAAAIVADVQLVGLDVRCGVHTGELEHIEGHLGGIAAHIGSRVQATAGPAEVRVTGTVRDLVVGGDITFDAVEMAELKGIPGRWALHSVSEVDGVPLPTVLDPGEAAARRGTAQPQASHWPRRPRILVVAVALLGAVALAGLAAIVLTLPRDAPSLGTDATPPPGRPPSLVGIDPETNEIVAEVYDNTLSRGWNILTIVNGSLWHETSTSMLRRDLATGEVIAEIDQPPETIYVLFGFGSIWFYSLDDFETRVGTLHRVDPISGRETAVVEPGVVMEGLAVGRTAIYLLTRDEILEVDPATNAVVDRDMHGLENRPDAFESFGRFLWICECSVGEITQWDPDTDLPVRTIALPERGFILNDARELSQGNVSVEQATVWLMNGYAGTLTPVDLTTGEPGPPIGIPQDAANHVFGFDSIWVAAKDEIYRVPLDTLRGESIPLPQGVQSGSMAADEEAGVLWLVNFVPWGEPFPPELP